VVADDQYLTLRLTAVDRMVNRLAAEKPVEA